MLDRDISRPRSLSHQFQHQTAILSKEAERTRSQHQTARVQRRQNISLAVSDLLPDCFVSIAAIWIDAEVLDKRKSAAGHYEYLVRPQRMTAMCAVWKHPRDIKNTELVREFEETRLKQIKDKTHLAAWYPFKEDLVVRWKDTSFFIVSYGNAQFNNFCIVGLDKTGTVLKCKKTHRPNQAQHQVHVQLVEKEMVKLQLKIHSKTICPINQTTTTTNTPINSPINKPFSHSPIKLQTSDQLHLIRQHQTATSLPMAFVPSSHPTFCKCESLEVLPDAETLILCKTRYKAAPDPASKPTTVWLPSGPPVTDRRAYVWRCQNHNSACNIYYDGNSDCIFNYSNSTMVSHAVLFDFLFGMATG